MRANVTSFGRQGGEECRCKTYFGRGGQAINEGTNYGNDAINKIRDAREMKINRDYDEYLRLKEESLMKQLEAFTSYHGRPERSVTITTRKTSRHMTR